MLSGPAHSQALRRDARALLASISLVRHRSAPAHPVRLVGGFAFGSCPPPQGAWRRFGPGLLILPRCTYGCSGADAWLSLAIQGPPGADAQEGTLDELAAITDMLERLPAPISAPSEGCEPPYEAPVSSPAGANGRRFSVAGSAGASAGALREWRRRIEAILREVEQGPLVKVVAARSAEARFEHPPDPAEVLRALIARFGECTGFCLDVGGAAFLGATPERLVRKAGDDVFTEALAGSAPPGAGDSLRGSPKDRREHELVRADVGSRLERLCDAVRSEASRPLELSNIAHLKTPIRAVARAGTELLDLVAALHPTPAVGGVPRELALEWIDEHEPEGRGWYAAPFGWLDAAGDGEFVVALRCALLRSRTARLYAGAGIVRGSDPAAEWAETEAKLQAVRAALAASCREGTVQA